MISQTENSITSDEKMMGAAAHFFGVIVALIVWALQKDKSRFVKFHALQAMAFDMIVTVIMGVVFFCIFGIVFLGISGSLFTAIGNDSPSDDIGLLFFFPVMFPFSFLACIFPFSFLLLIVRLVASVSVLNGRNFHYPLLGKWLDNFLDN